MPKPRPPIDPTAVIGEILGEPAALMREPVNADYRCPFTPNKCIKHSPKIPGVPYPVCSAYRAGGSDAAHLMCLCPKRFYQVDFLKEVIAQCWPGEKPKNLKIVHEVKMEGFGNVDFVLADVSDDGTSVRNFVSVELQAVDINGSYEPAYTATINSQMLAKRPGFGFNYANVRKRYLSQLVAKGFFHHHWSRRIVAVIQDHIYNKFREWGAFDELPPASDSANIVFLIYKYSGDSVTGYSLVFDRAIGTSHSSLMMVALYMKPPERLVFDQRIISRLATEAK